MHDISVIEPLCKKLEQIASENKAQKVVRIVLEVGEDFDFTPEHFQETLLLLSNETPLLRDAKLEFRKVPGFHDHEMILRDVELEVPEQDEQ
jgi:Zn finger protein HypA/HybF involved in hydrogenase expression